MINLVDIASTFSFIADKGLILSAANYDPQAFGDVSLVIAGLPFSLRLVRDRDQVFVDIGNDAAGWYKLEYVLEFVDNSITQKHLSEPPDITLLANLLQGNWDKTSQLFSDEQKMSQLNSFANQKTVDLLSKIFNRK